MKPLRIEDEAEEELNGAADYYEGKHAGLGLAFEERIREAFQRIQRDPGLFPFYKKTPCQKCLVEQFPYLVFYREFAEHISLSPWPTDGVNPVTGANGSCRLQDIAALTVSASIPIHGSCAEQMSVFVVRAFVGMRGAVRTVSSSG